MKPKLLNFSESAKSPLPSKFPIKDMTLTLYRLNLNLTQG